MYLYQKEYCNNQESSSSSSMTAIRSNSLASKHLCIKFPILILVLSSCSLQQLACFVLVSISLMCYFSLAYKLRFVVYNSLIFKLARSNCDFKESISLKYFKLYEDLYALFFYSQYLAIIVFWAQIIRFAAYSIFYFYRSYFWQMKSISYQLYFYFYQEDSFFFKLVEVFGFYVLFQRFEVVFSRFVEALFVRYESQLTFSMLYSYFLENTSYSLGNLLGLSYLLGYLGGFGDLTLQFFCEEFQLGEQVQTLQLGTLAVQYFLLAATLSPFSED